jgi:uroporphyrin-III C-methyltransferase
VHPEVLALARGRLVDVGKRYGKVSTEQRFINRALIEAARAHALVVRLKGGDPMLFGRAQEEIDALEAAGIEVEVVPGVTAALAAAASLRVSLTRRGIARTVAFLTPRVGRDETASEWLPAALGADTVALYMAAGAARSIAAQMIAAGKPTSTPAALVENATLPGEQRLVTTLGALSAADLPRADGPVVMCVGEVFADAARIDEALAPRGMHLAWAG